jgi:hypothetical protein
VVSYSTATFTKVQLLLVGTLFILYLEFTKQGCFCFAVHASVVSNHKQNNGDLLSNFLDCDCETDFDHHCPMIFASMVKVGPKIAQLYFVILYLKIAVIKWSGY